MYPLKWNRTEESSHGEVYYTVHKEEISQSTGIVSREYGLVRGQHDCISLVLLTVTFYYFFENIILPEWIIPDELLLASINQNFWITPQPAFYLIILVPDA